MIPRVRFAPSPTGNIHIGNIRAAIFNWLFARHEGGRFLLRMEDTDRERCTSEAIGNLLDIMDWLGLSYDEEIFYQSEANENHLASARRLVNEGSAYRHSKGGKGEATVFRIPWDAEEVPGVSVEDTAEISTHTSYPTKIRGRGVNYAGVSRKGKPMPQSACLAGFRDLEIFDSEGNCLFKINDFLERILDKGETFTVENAARLRFLRRRIVYDDLIKGTLSKPIDSLKDFVIVRSDGSPVFHLANVCDDITQRITHIIRGDDHVENTYKHLFLYAALGHTAPEYAHLPMIVNAQGKPYSKRDGDAFAGEFREKGFLPEALFNYLTFLGWSPGDDREKFTREELAEVFTLDRVQQAPARMDQRKLQNLNGQYMAEMPLEDFLTISRRKISEFAWGEEIDDSLLAKVAGLMQSRTKVLTDIAAWKYFFIEGLEYDSKACRKYLGEPETCCALIELRDRLSESDYSDPAKIESVIHGVTESMGIRRGKFNQPIRVAVTGVTTGAGIYETLWLLGPEKTDARLEYAVTEICGQAPDGECQ